jgi:hypothetical protein
MQLSYRGVKYEYHPPVIKAISSKVIGQYRGAVLKTTKYAQPPLCESLMKLKYRVKYRGIGYTSTSYSFRASNPKSVIL